MILRLGSGIDTGLEIIKYKLEFIFFNKWSFSFAIVKFLKHKEIKKMFEELEDMVCQKKIKKKLKKKD